MSGLIESCARCLCDLVDSSGKHALCADCRIDLRVGTKRCKASERIDHATHVCNALAAGVVLEVFDVEPYDLHVCGIHKARFSGHRFVALNRDGERDPSSVVVLP